MNDFHTIVCFQPLNPFKKLGNFAEMKKVGKFFGHWDLKKILSLFSRSEKKFQDLEEGGKEKGEGVEEDKLA